MSSFKELRISSIGMVSDFFVLSDELKPRLRQIFVRLKNIFSYVF